MAKVSTAVSATAFGRTLRNRFGVKQHRANGIRFYLGITVLDGETRSPELERLDLQ
jgi:hypothetical protein